MNDQTATEPTEFDKSIQGKTVLLIGSGQDLDGRRMKNLIDDPNSKFDLVARLNKHYGTDQDTGTRTDIIITRWSQWLTPLQGFFTESDINNAKKIIILNQFLGYSQSEGEALKLETGLNKTSAGIQALHYFINRGAKRIYIIGFGYYSDGINRGKTYCKNSFNYPAGMRDTNKNYDWVRQKNWINNQRSIIKL